MSAEASWRRHRTNRLAGAGITIALHVVVIGLLLTFQPIRIAATRAVPIMVSLITPPPPVVEKPEEPPKPLPVKPRQTRVKPPPPPPTFVAQAETLPPLISPLPQTVSSPPLALLEARSEPSAPVVPSAPAGPPSPEPAAAPIVPASFNAAYLNNPAPAYPPVARRTGQQGTVVLRVLVNARGLPDKVEIRTSSSFNQLDDAAADAVRHWKFIPARQGDQPVAAWVLVPVTFTLQG